MRIAFRILTVRKLIFTAIFLSLIPALLTADWMPVEWMNDPGVRDSIRIEQAGHQTYIDLKDIANTLGIKWLSDSSNRRIRLDTPVQPLIFSVRSPFILAGDELRQIPLPVRMHQDRLLAPLEPLVALLADYYPGEILYDPSRFKLLVTPPRHDLFGLRYDIQPGLTRVIIPAGRLLECKTEELNDQSILLRFPGGRIDTAAFNNKAKAGLIVEVRAEQQAMEARITLIPDSAASFSRFEQITDPPLYCVEFTGQSWGGLDPEAQKRLDDDKIAWALDVVVIDPGHGGKDPGAIGPNKLYERDVVLDVGLRLRKALESKGVRTVMARDTDVFIPLGRRAKIANDAGGKIFVSLHCNAIPGGNARGMETYFLAPAKTERAVRVAMTENSVIKFEESRDQYQDLTEENYILLTMAQANFARESEELAAIVQQQVCSGLSLRDRGVDQAGFYVLIGASMPSILVEMLFINNKTDTKKLRDRWFRQQMAEYLCGAIIKFLEKSRG